jgi:NADH-quinone oxidoreductase subunit J
MIAHAIVFYRFSLIAIVSAIMVTGSKNTGNSVFFLILDFISISCLFIMIGAEFLGMIMLIVYVGAVAVLFLFVVMMLDIKIGDNSLSFLAYGPVGYFLVFLFLLEITIPLINLVGSFDSVFSSDVNYFYVNWLQEIDYITNINAIGQLLYTYYFVYFLMSGLILYIAMIGALMLTLTLNRVVKKQIVYKQLARQGDNSFLKVK